MSDEQLAAGGHLLHFGLLFLIACGVLAWFVREFLRMGLEERRRRLRFQRDSRGPSLERVATDGPVPLAPPIPPSVLAHRGDDRARSDRSHR